MNPRYIFAVSSHLLLYKVASATDPFLFVSLTFLFFLVFVGFGSSQFESSILSLSLPQALSIPCTSSSLLSSKPEKVLLASPELPVSCRNFRSAGRSTKPPADLECVHPDPELPVHRNFRWCSLSYIRWALGENGIFFLFPPRPIFYQERRRPGRLQEGAPAPSSPTAPLQICSVGSFPTSISRHGLRYLPLTPSINGDLALTMA